ncbi:LysM peptidoglycan-binding domain-containing protein [Lentisphaerota bacterium WC36G]|nr:LysM peptidoglycan-binding domain-containing protein [Lentisphaerae bacterium WC36]
MNKKIIVLVTSVVSFVTLSGCGPTLAQPELGEKEQSWKGYIEKSYSNWEVPTMLPPVEEDALNSEESTTSVVDDSEVVNIAPSPLVVTDMNTTVNPPLQSNTAPVTNEPKVVNLVKQQQYYTVKKGDNLSKIARKFYGKPNWKKIYDANSDILNNKNKLKPGMELVIPQ